MCLKDVYLFEQLSVFIFLFEGFSYSILLSVVGFFDRIWTLFSYFLSKFDFVLYKILLFRFSSYLFNFDLFFLITLNSINVCFVSWNFLWVCSIPSCFLSTFRLIFWFLLTFWVLFRRVKFCFWGEGRSLGDVYAVRWYLIFDLRGESLN